MKRELLDSFIIIDLYDKLVLMETEDTLKLLGLKNFDWIPDSIQREALVTYLEADEKEKINGGIRVSGGNSHDATFDTEVVIVNGGGIWKDELDKYRDMHGSTYSTKPVIKEIEEFNEEIRQEWFCGYDLGACGESERLIYCSDEGYGKIYGSVYKFKKVWGSRIDSLGKEDVFPRSFMCLEKVKSKEIKIKKDEA